MRSTLLIPLTTVATTLLGGALADSANIFAVPYPVIAYALNAEPGVATTYLVACPRDLATADCPFNQPYVLTEGPKTLHFEFTAEVANGATQSLTLGCDLDGTTSMGCQATGLNAISEGAKPSETFVWTGKDATTLFKNVEIVTDQASLMTWNRAMATASVAASITSTSSTTAQPTINTASNSTGARNSTSAPLTTPAPIANITGSTPSSALPSGSPISSAPANGAQPMVMSLGSILLGGLAAAIVLL